MKDQHLPIELNEENVLKIYNNCLMKKTLFNCHSSDLLPVKIFTKSSCGKDSPEICFNKSKVEEYKAAIEYMYGQLYEVHHGEYSITKEKFLEPADGLLNYINQRWTNDQKTLMSFYYLGVAAIVIMPFIIDPITHRLGVDLIDITPTLSPNDPNF